MAASDTSQGPNKWLQLAALCTVPLIMVLGNSMLIPVLPDMGRVMALDKSTTGLAVTAFSLAAGVGIALAGFLADRYGRKVVIVPSLLLYGAGGVISGLAGWWLAEDGFFWVMVGRVIQGLGAAGTAPVAMAFVGDLFKGGQRVTALGILEASNGLGKVVSPILGALVGELFVWWGVFFAYAGLSLPFALAVWFLTKEPKRKKAGSAKQYFGSVMKVFKEKGVPLVACFWAGTVALFLLFGVLFFLSEHLESAHDIDGVPKGTLIMWPVLAMSLTSFASGLFLQKRQNLLKPAVVAGLVVVTGGMALVAFIPQDWAFFTGVIVGGVGTGLQLPGLNNLITSAAGTEQRAGITSIYGAVRFIGVAFGPPIYGALMKNGESVPFWFSAVLAGITLAVTMFLIHPEQLIGKGQGQQGGGGGGGGKAKKKIPAWQPPKDLPSGTRGENYEPIG
ncbi:MAG TPA: MFS transporter [Symbiobacteriaceae bacterium]|nr:MFS transporter [Symbiobacteriaceae bacterium]